MKNQILNSKKLSSNNCQTRLPFRLGERLIWAFILLLTTSIQAQNPQTSKMGNSPVETTKTATLKSKKIQEPNIVVIADSLKRVFYKNAKSAGLTDEKTNELLKIIDERNAVVADFVSKRERHNAPFNVQDPWVMYNYKIDQAQKYYAKKIKDLLTYEQYGHFVVVNFREEAEEKSKVEFQQLIEGNPSLTNDQKIKLYGLIYGYQLNLLLTTAYYNFDRTLQKAKQGALTFNFEKKFAETCKDYNIKTDKLKESSANNFQWN